MQGIRSSMKVKLLAYGSLALTQEVFKSLFDSTVVALYGACHLDFKLVCLLSDTPRRQ